MGGSLNEEALPAELLLGLLDAHESI